MNRRAAVLCAVLVLAACDAARGAATAQEICTRQQDGPAAPSASFRDFLATKPTPAAFRARHPGTMLVLPGDIATRELRMDCSRFFADVDAQGRIAGGRFG